ncbi:hypothetical protein [Aquimarina sp. MMG016]|uniref:hypothetical protein n=1 Tax=Aquimarina sp. MMG016 TaxID=2822690 RepID=UPI001B3A6717|nr:hypothetical protein [Aquimarina sp. MMG016]MBQ4818493.1 hypothetical protein [Aquimarina sp. MMG016]
MKLKILIPTVFLLIIHISFGQEYKSSTESIKIVDTKIVEGSYNADEQVKTDNLIVKSLENRSSNIQSYSKKEWKKIRKKMRKAKKRISNNGDIIHTSKVLDTVFISPSYSNNRTQLSGW